MTDVMDAIGAELAGHTAPDAEPAAPAPVEAPAPSPEAPAPAETPAPVEAPQTDATAQPEPVPYFSAMLDERDKRKSAQAEAEQLRRELAARTASQPQVPSVIDDPEGFQNYVDQRVKAAEWNARVEMSHRFVSDKHGEILEPAKEWFEGEAKKNPLLVAEFQRSPDPFALIVDKYRQHQALNSLGGKTFEDAAREWAIAQGFVAQPGSSAPATAQASPPATPSAPTRSLAAQPTAGGPDTVPLGKLAGLDSVFPPPG